MTLEQITEQVRAEAGTKLTEYYRDAAVEMANRLLTQHAGRIPYKFQVESTMAIHALERVQEEDTGYRPYDPNGGNLYKLNEKKAQKYGERQADAVIRNFASKFHHKVGGARSFKLWALSWSHWRAEGVVDAAGTSRFSIEQRMIVNVSPRGLPFNQFPALIYVDGKRTSERDFREMVVPGNTRAEYAAARAKFVAEAPGWYQTTYQKRALAFRRKWYRVSGEDVNAAVAEVDAAREAARQARLAERAVPDTSRRAT